MEEREERGGAVRVGMVWGGIGGVVGLVASLLGSLVGIVVACFIGVACGRRAAAAEERAGALSGLVGGAVAAPVYVVGSTLGALLAARAIGSSRLATTLSDVLGTRVSADEAWTFFLVSLVLSAILEVMVLVIASTAAGAWAKRWRSGDSDRVG
jgi:hypothetical protein